MLGIHDSSILPCFIGNWYNHTIQKHWREVFLLVAGLAPGKRGADDLLLAMEREAQTFLNRDKLKSLVVWATLATENSPGNIDPLAKRVAAIVLVFALVFARARDLALVFDLALDLARARVPAFASALAPDINFSLGLARNLDLAINLANEYQKIGVFPISSTDKVILDLEHLKFQFSTEKMSRHKLKKLKLKVIEAFARNLNLEMELLLISDESFEQIANYFYTLELMIPCKEAAVRVSPQVWAGIESRMVTVPD